MGEIRALLTGFTPGAAGIWTLVVMGAAFLIREWREIRKLSSADRLARREGYAAQVSSLTAENRALRKEMGEIRRDAASDVQEIRTEFADYRKLCEHETSQLRGELRAALDTMEGVKRRAIHEQILEIQSRPAGSVPDHIRAAAERVQGYLAGSDAGKPD